MLTNLIRQEAIPVIHIYLATVFILHIRWVPSTCDGLYTELLRSHFRCAESGMKARNLGITVIHSTTTTTTLYINLFKGSWVVCMKRQDDNNL
jgi:hypothetical protein